MSADVADLAVGAEVAVVADRAARTAPRKPALRAITPEMCMVNLDHRLRIVSASMEFFRVFERSSDAVTGTGLCDLLHPSVRSKVENQLRLLARGERSRFVERILVMRENGTTLSGEFIGSTVHGVGDRLDSLTVVFRPDKNERGNQVACGKKKILSEIDARILEGVASGVSTIQLAANLYMSRGGVEYHVTTLLRKMKVKNRPALISKAYSMGIFGVGSWPPRALPDFVR
ncbi:DNA-binding CsgD family transcriptional regulator [Amycolatopsis lexingtonensis]|uniref:DNA-binding CsgD family transcriptional regulator n=1 Tax=Amycolatopsis lexingtonensis TaxID=218822 RepID=A0ABR9I066_9PSEU|nr:helix-turn-helix transcriptional regulator [Amycolatopsis lexingtonensis]MBE1496575.1 DNA-binding CsgD family transcriptional regulator [Amycolatopsis lexingtonensis]